MSAVSKRDTAKNAIKRSLAASKQAAGTHDQSSIEAYIKLLNNQWNAFQLAHDLVLESCGQSTISTQEDEFIQAEEWYRGALSNLYRLLSVFKLSEQATPITTHPSMNISAAAAPRPAFKLPPITLPTFDGVPYEWKSFHDRFVSLVHNNETLTGSQKLHYLRNSLQGEPLNVIQSFPITDDNFNEAWSCLKNRYDVLRVIVDSHLAALFAIPKVKDESATAIKALLDTVLTHFRTLKALNRPADQWDDWLVHLTVNKLDSESRKQWEMSLTTSTVPLFDDLTQFLEKRCRSLSALESHTARTQAFKNSKAKHTWDSLHISSKRTHSKAKQHNYAQTSGSRSLTLKRNVCTYCGGDHFIYACQQFKSLACTARSNAVMSKNLCLNCLSNGHQFGSCRSLHSCRICAQRHHTLLHTDGTLSVNCANIRQQVLLATAIVNILDSSGCQQPARVLFDTGSHVSFVTEACVQRLKVSRYSHAISITGIGASPAGQSKGSVSLLLSSLVSDFSITIEALILSKITNEIPSTGFNRILWPHLSHLQLADPQFFRSASIDILLGADELGAILLEGLVKGPVGAPVAQNSAFGWVLLGQVQKVDTSTSNVPRVSLHANAELTEAVSKFWELEDIPMTKHRTDEEQACEKIFADTHCRLHSGRYVVELPFRPELPLGNSRNGAIKALHRVEAQFKRNQSLHDQYKAFMKEFVDLGHMEEAAPNPPPEKSYYMPHRAVIKESSTTTKLRVVFNASKKSSSGISLNDTQMIGPQLQPALATILLRFCTHRFAMTADVAKMYRQINVAKEHCEYQRIVWRESSDDPIKDYVLLTVTYGVASAPHLTVKCLQQVAIDEGKDLPIAAAVVLTDFYMDDLLTGCNNEADLNILRSQICVLLQRGCFELRKWVSNSEAVLKAIPIELRETKASHSLADEGTVKALGLQWNPAYDYLSFAVHLPEVKLPVTKRSLLSDSAKLFDPLGFLSPCTILAKMMFQQLWRPKLDWDDEVPDHTLRQWLHYRRNLDCLSNLQIPRWLGMGEAGAVTDLHCFADASQAAYAAVIYARTIFADGSIAVKLVTAKTRVAPVDVTSLPRLELCAAGLLAKLLEHVHLSISNHFRGTYGWTDSTVTLAWIHGHPSKWVTFVANRVAQIQKVLPPEHWRHVSSTDNPADCASRGILPEKLVYHPLWWTGPPWLSEPEHSWKFHQHTSYDTELDICSNTQAVLQTQITVQPWDLLDMYSSLSKLKRITAVILRFIYNCKCRIASNVNIRQGYIKHTELNDAFEFWVRSVQAHHFSEDINNLQDKKPLSTRSKLIKLRPFMDSKGVLRVGGRLRQAPLRTDVKYPILLPAKSTLTKLVCTEIHSITLHAGPQLMQTVLLTRFWVLSARGILRKIAHDCITCCRFRHTQHLQLMGDLPKARVEPARPFLRSGVDFAGPFPIRYSKGRGAKATKGYIAIFICMASGAMHLELSSDLSTATFIAAYKRFIARRGHCKELYSDNGTNFVGAEKELRALLSQASVDEQLHRYLSNDHVTWHFNPPAAPHMGGYWEAAVKRVKFHLRRALACLNITLTYEEFITLLADIEACVNSRPLCQLPSETDDLKVLTPGHRLIGEPLKALPEPDMLRFKGTLLNRWQSLSQIRQYFWQRWSGEYLVSLQRRTKWIQPARDFQAKDLVIIRDERFPPTRWKMGRITKVHPGQDGKVRVATVRTAEGELSRPIVKLCLLPLSDDVSSQ